MVKQKISLVAVLQPIQILPTFTPYIQAILRVFLRKRKSAGKVFSCHLRSLWWASASLGCRVLFLPCDVETVKATVVSHIKMAFSRYQAEGVVESIKRIIKSFLLAVTFCKNDKMWQTFFLGKLRRWVVVNFFYNSFQGSFNSFPIFSVDFKSKVHFERLFFGDDD